MRWGTLTLALAMMVTPALRAAPSADEPAPQYGEIKDRVYRHACLSVARVTHKSDLGTEVATGFFVGAPGQMITVLSPVGETESIEVRHCMDSEKRWPAKLLAADPYTGLTLLQVEGAAEVRALEVVSSAGLAVGDFVYSVADTEDIAEACTVGRVAGRDKGIDGKPLATSVLRLNITSPAGAFGGPLLDEKGGLVGVLLLGGGGDNAEGIGYALPSDLVGKLLRDFEKHGRAAGSWLGFGMEMGTTTPEVRSLREGSPAAAAGLRAGDIIISIGGRKMGDYQDVIDACYALTAGIEATFVVLRGLDDLSIKVMPTLREKP